MKRLILVVSLLLVGTSITSAAAQLPPGGHLHRRQRQCSRGQHRSNRRCRDHKGLQPADQRSVLSRRVGDEGSDGSVSGAGARIAVCVHRLLLDTDGSVFQSDINALAAAGITKGCNPPANDRFCPDESVTRGANGGVPGQSARSASNQSPTTSPTTTDRFLKRASTSCARPVITQGCNPPGE